MRDQTRIYNLLRQFTLCRDPDCLDDALEALAPYDENVVAALADALNHESGEVRLLTIQILGRLGPKAEPVLPAMIRALKDEDRIVRIAALEPVANFGAKAKAAVPILEKWLTSDDQFAKVSAAGHILMIDESRTDDMMPFIEEALSSENTVIQRQAQWLLDELGMSTSGANSE